MFLLPEAKHLPAVGKSVSGVFAVTAGSKGMFTMKCCISYNTNLYGTFAGVLKET